jgi:hypothetical protein
LLGFYCAEKKVTATGCLTAKKISLPRRLGDRAASEIRATKIRRCSPDAGHQANEPIHEENKTGDKQNNLGGIETRRPNPRAEIGGKLQQQDPIRCTGNEEINER